MILFAIFAALIGMTLLEVYVVITVGQAIGVWPTIGLMLLDAFIGSLLMRSQGRAVWGRFREDVSAGRLPTRHVLDGALVVAGGAFLITPGFVTDLFGILLLLPPSRAVARRFIVRRITGRMGAVASVGGAAAFGAGRRANSAWQARRGDSGSAAGDADIDGTSVEIDDRELER
jgi:UPF0716 protein FxsA